MAYDPLAAPDPRPREFKNPMRLVHNAVEDAPIRVKQASKIPLDTHTPFWVIRYESLDAQREDGTPLTTEVGSFLFDREGYPLDKNQLPAVMAQAFAGLGIRIFPDDPDYVEEDVLGQCFMTKAVGNGRKGKNGKEFTNPIPIEALGPDWQLPEGQAIRVIASRQSTGDGAVSVTESGAPVSVELSTNPALLARLSAALVGVDPEDDEGQIVAVQSLGIKGGSLKGESLFNLAFSRKLVEAVAAVSG